MESDLHVVFGFEQDANFRISKKIPYWFGIKTIVHLTGLIWFGSGKMIADWLR